MPIGDLVGGHDSGGPPVSPPQRKGFGSHLVERGLAQELGGAVRLIYDSSGVVFRIAMPLHSRRSKQDAAEHRYG